MPQLTIARSASPATATPGATGSLSCRWPEASCTKQSACRLAGDNVSMIRRRVVVRGTVQGVFFRDSCRREAKRRQVSGWVTNRSDGSVEAVFEGEPDQVDAMVAWTRHGPPRAKVTHVEVISEDLLGESGFRVVSGRA